MDQISSYVSRKSGSFPTLMARKSEAYLPVSTKPQSKFRMKALLGHCLYRRVVIWTVVVIVLLSVTLFNPRLTARSRDVLDLVHGAKGDIKDSHHVAEGTGIQKQQGDQAQEQEQEQEEIKEDEEEKKEDEEDELLPETVNGPHWLRYRQ